ncbi:type II secretion system F family protein [bacterium]|nr:type II secretion system F family protein [bacterium]
MPEYRYIGVNVEGKPIQGIVISPNEKTVKGKVRRLAKSKGIRVDAIQKKSLYVYKVQKDTEKPVVGRQKAFSDKELHRALVKMGYRVLYVRKKLFEINFKVPTKDLVLFIRICADLLKEKFPYDEILTLVSNDTENRRLRETIREIQKDLKAGDDGHKVYGKHVEVFGKFTAHMLAVASTSGNMAAIYESTAKFLERESEFKSDLRSILVMPIMVTLAMLGAIMFYVMYIFPKMTSLLVKYDIEIPPMTSATMSLSSFMQDYYLIILAAVLLPGLLFFQWTRSDRGRYLIDQTIIRLPVIGNILHKISIEIFARVFHALYSSSGENITAIKVAAASCRNRFIEKQITSNVIPKMLKGGKSFVECMFRTNCFTLTAVRRLKSGEESGTLRESALQLANYYEKETSHKMRRVVDFINITVAVIITLLIIGLTLLSTEIGFVSPSSPLSG